MGDRSPPNRFPIQRPELATVFPFGVDFQRVLLRLLTEDVAFASEAMPHLMPAYFENEVLAWAYHSMEQYREKYNAVPSLKVIQDEAGRLDSSVREFYRLTIEQVSQADMSSEPWLRDQCLDFIKRNIYVRGHQESTAAFNKGDVDKAYEISMKAADKILNTDWKAPDRAFFFETFPQRHSQRLSEDPMMDSISTGIHELDKVLGGGLSKGELGVWMAHSKRGKTTLLTNHGVQAVRRGNRNVLHLVFEGARKQVEARYDTIFAQESYHKVRAGDISSETYQRMQYEYQMFHRRLVVRGFTEEWGYTVANIFEELRELKQLHNWVPEMLIVDYGDLLRGREGEGCRTETEHQTSVFKDLKSMANRGYALWSASQPQRPKDDIESKTEILTSKNIADAYAKVRVADFIGSANQTSEERLAKIMRLHAEMYRDNAANKTFVVEADFDLMTIKDIRGSSGSHFSAVPNGPVPIGYVANGNMRPIQRKAPI